MANSNLFQYALIHCCFLLVGKTRDSRTKVIKMDSKGNKTLATNVEEFEMMKNYMFITTRMVSGECVMVCLEQLEIYVCLCCGHLLNQSEDKPSLVNQQCIVCCFKCDLCDAGYVAYSILAATSTYQLKNTKDGETSGN